VISCLSRTSSPSRLELIGSLTSLGFDWGKLLLVKNWDLGTGVTWSGWETGTVGPLGYARVEANRAGQVSDVHAKRMWQHRPPGLQEKKRGEEEMGWLGNIAPEGLKNPLYFLIFESNLTLNRIWSSPIRILMLSTQQYKIKCRQHEMQQANI
jgi:hypothetical protein